MLLREEETPEACWSAQELGSLLVVEDGDLLFPDCM